jgi:small subunit ribosomal protein S16
LTDHKNSSKSGRFKEILGAYDPRKTTELLKVDRIKHWMSVGATPTDTVHNLLVNHKVIDAKKKNVLPKKTYTAPVVEAPAEPVQAEAAPAPEAEAPVESTEATPELVEEAAAPIEEAVSAPAEESAPAPAEEAAPEVAEAPAEATEAPVETPEE